MHIELKGRFGPSVKIKPDHVAGFRVLGRRDGQEGTDVIVFLTGGHEVRGEADDENLARLEAVVSGSGAADVWTAEDLLWKANKDSMNSE